MGKKVLNLNKDDFYSEKIESTKEMEESIFFEAYEKAYKNLNLICYEKSTNNIIAFMGDRGSGKSSCTKSFLNSLNEDNIFKSDLPEEFKNGFEILDIIEPSHFTEKINIVEIVISLLFKVFSKKLEEDTTDYELKKELLKQFQKVYKSMKYIGCKEEYKTSEIEELEMLSTTISLKKDLEILLDKYLKLMKKKKLVITVDDLDFNIDYAYEMLEGLRKYFSLKNVVIIMNLKYEQLELAIQEKYLRDIHENLNYFSNPLLLRQVTNRVKSYLLKAFPFERRIYLKNLDEHNEEIEISTKELSGEYKATLSDRISKKLGIYLKPNGKLIKIFLSSNLREFLGGVKVSTLETKTEIREYILTNLLKNNLNTEEQYSVLEFLKSPSIREIDLLEREFKTTKDTRFYKFNRIIKEYKEENNMPLTYQLFFYSMFLRDEQHKEFYKDLYIEDYLKEFISEEEFKIQVDKDKKETSEITALFFDKREERSEKKIELEGRLSIINPFYKILLKENTDYKGLILKDIELIIDFYSFLSISNLKFKFDSIEDFYKHTIEFYEITLLEFQNNLPEFANIRNDFDTSRKKLLKDIKKIKTLNGYTLEKKTVNNNIS